MAITSPAALQDDADSDLRVNRGSPEIQIPFWIVAPAADLERLPRGPVGNSIRRGARENGSQPERNERIVEKCRELEHRLEHVAGHHLFKKLREIGLPPHLMTSARFLFAVRDKCVHRKGFYVDSDSQLIASVEDAYRELAEAIPRTEPQQDRSGNWLTYTSIAGLVGGMVFLLHGASFWLGACWGLLLGGYAGLSALQQDC